MAISIVLHPDHVAGAVDAQGVAVFPNAEMIVPEAKFAYWHDDGEMSRAPKAVQPFFVGARTFASAYADRLTRIDDEAEIFDAIRAVPLPGHTPGHSGYMIDSQGEALLIWAEAVHHAAFQFPRPAWNAGFDMDPEGATASRLRMFDRASADRLLVAGMHMPFPRLRPCGTRA